MGAKQRNFYEILGLAANVSSLEIKRAYRNLVKSEHPDVDYSRRTHGQRSTATERMMRLNEAYETLKDRSKRAEYDSIIGVNGRGKAKISGVSLVQANDSDHARQKYLTRVFHPARAGIGKALNKYKQQLSVLSADIYDDRLLADFAIYVDEIEGALASGSQLLSSLDTPSSLGPAELMMRYAIAQGADGLDELRNFMKNYDYDHLYMAGNLFREYVELSKKALHLTKP